MKRKTIRKIINAKVDHWLKSIKDEELRKDLKKGVIVTGGCIPSMLLNEEVNDYDIYLRNYRLAERLAQYYVDKFEVKNAKGIHVPISVQGRDKTEIDGRGPRIVVKSAGIASEKGSEKPYEYFESVEDDNAAGDYIGDLAEVLTNQEDIEDAYDEVFQELKNQKTDKRANYRPLFLSTNAITLSDGIQIVLRFVGEPEEIHKNYDFVHCTNYWTSWNNKIVLHADAIESILTKELIYTGSMYPVASLFRTRKFIKRGWTINAGQMLKMIMQVSDLDMHNINVLRDQLTGVDVAYFYQLLNMLESKEGNIETAYIVEIVDTIFNDDDVEER